MKRRGFIIVSVLVLTVAGAVAAYWYTRQAPLPAMKDVHAGMDFMASDAYTRMSDQQRLGYAMKVVDGLRSLSYDEYLAVISRHDERQMRMYQNLRATPGHDKVSAAIFALFLDRFWEQNPGKRAATLTAIALIQQSEFGKHPERYGLPTHQQIKSEMNKFVTNQPVRTQAQCAQFMVELKRQREMMGLKDPF
jgi:hypothetical protein